MGRLVLVLSHPRVTVATRSAGTHKEAGVDVDLVTVQDNALKLQVELALTGRKLDRLELAARALAAEVSRRCPPAVAVP